MLFDTMFFYTLSEFILGKMVQLGVVSYVFNCTLWNWIILSFTFCSFIVFI